MTDPDETVRRPGARPADPDATVLRPQSPGQGRPTTANPVPPTAAAPGPSHGQRQVPEAAWPAERPSQPGQQALLERDPTTIVTPRRAANRDVTTLVLPREPAATADAADAAAQAMADTVVQPPPGTDRTQPRGSAPGPLPRRKLGLPRGLQLLEYRIERVLGQGGFGITYLATDEHLDAKVAIKEYLPEEIAFRSRDRSVWPNASQHRDRYRQGLENFLVEARTLASFRHPNIVRVARFFEAHATAYMVMEYERGQSFKTWWLAQGQQGQGLLLERLQPLLDGLAVVHAAGYLHRDIKPDNIQVRKEDGRFVLLDFGSAGQTVALADQDAVVVTPGYAPIEQYGLGGQGAWTDIYALGATLYWAVAGRKPPDAESRANGTALAPATDVGRGRFGPSFLAAVDWALEVDPAARPRSVHAWRDRLLADHVASAAPDPGLGADSLLDDPDDRPRRHAVPERWRSAWRRLRRPGGWPLAVQFGLPLLALALLPGLAAMLWLLPAAQNALVQAERLRLEQHVVTLAAALAPDARPEAVDAVLAPAVQATGPRPWLIDDRGDFVRPPPVDHATRRPDEAHLWSALQASPQRGSLVFEPVAGGPEEIAAFAAVPGTHWTLGLSEPAATAWAPLKPWRDGLPWALLLGAVVAAAVLLRLVRHVVRPLRSMAASTQALKTGDFDHAYVDVPGRDEVGQLGRSINRLVDALRERERERATRRRS